MRSESDSRMSKVVDIRPLVFHVFHGFRVGGTEVRTCRIINALRDRYRHIIFSINGNFDAKSLIQSSADVCYLTHKESEKSFLSYWFHIHKILRREKPDLLILYAWGAIDWILVNSITRICPMIHAAEGFDDSELHRQIWRRLILRRILFQRCDKVVTCSRMLEQISYEIWNLHQEKVVYIPNGVDLNQFVGENRKSNEHNDIVVQNDYLACGIVASLIKLKNHQRLLRSFARLLQKISAVLFITGDGPERNEVVRYSQELGIESSVILLGHLSDPSEVLSQIDIFCLSSDTEQAPMVVLEAMAAGLPIVSTDVGDVKVMVARENRPFVVEKDNDGDYQAALQALAEDKELRVAVGSANRKKCSELYDERLMFKRYDALYSSTIRSELIKSTQKKMI